MPNDYEESHDTDAMTGKQFSRLSVPYHRGGVHVDHRVLDSGVPNRMLDKSYVCSCNKNVERSNASENETAASPLEYQTKYHISA